MAWTFCIFSSYSATCLTRIQCLRKHFCRKTMLIGVLAHSFQLPSWRFMQAAIFQRGLTTTQLNIFNISIFIHVVEKGLIQTQLRNTNLNVTYLFVSRYVLTGVFCFSLSADISELQYIEWNGMTLMIWKPMDSMCAPYSLNWSFYFH